MENSSPDVPTSVPTKALDAELLIKPGGRGVHIINNFSHIISWRSTCITKNLTSTSLNLPDKCSVSASSCLKPERACQSTPSSANRDETGMIGADLICRHCGRLGNTFWWSIPTALPLHNTVPQTRLCLCSPNSLRVRPHVHVCPHTELCMCVTTQHNTTVLSAKWWTATSPLEFHHWWDITLIHDHKLQPITVKINSVPTECSGQLQPSADLHVTHFRQHTHTHTHAETDRLTDWLTDRSID